MSRQRNLIKQLFGHSDEWKPNVILANVPTIMLENDFIRAVCAAANASMLECMYQNDIAMTQINISANK